MLTPEYLKALPENMVRALETLEDQVIFDISRRISKDMTLTETADYQINILRDMGYSLPEIRDALAANMDIAAEELDALMIQSVQDSYEGDRAAYALGGKVLPPLADNLPIMQFIEGARKQWLQDFSNLTGTYGFVDNGIFKPLDTFYRDTMNYAVLQVGSSAMDYQRAIREAVRKLGDSGITTIDYITGKHFKIEHVARMTLLTGTNQITGHISLANADLMEQDLMEITAHPGARPSHAEWQGEIVSRSGRIGYIGLDYIGYGDVGGFMGANCRHNWYPFFEGISTRNWDKQSLSGLDPPDFEYNGKHYTAYEATQKQRQIERQMRATKRRLVAYDGAGLKDDFTAQAVKLRLQKDAYKDFSRAAGLPEQNVRHQTYKFNRSASAKTVWAERKANK